MKICLLTRYFDYRNAGIGRVSCELRDRLRARGHDVVTVSTDKESLSSYLRYTMLDIRRQIPPDCDVYHAITPMEGMWLPKSKSIVTYLDLIPMVYPERTGAGIGHSRIKNTIGKKYFALAARKSANARVLTTISTLSQQHVRERLGKDAEIVQLGIRDDLQPLLKRDSVFRVGYLGQLDRRKRVGLLIDKFKTSGINGELVIAGAGRDGDVLREQAGDDKRIKFVGFVPDDKLCAFYNSLSVFAFPTWVEGYGLPIVEAFACKKPVIVWKDAAIPDEIKRKCYQVNGEYDFGGFVQKVSKATGFINDNYRFAKSHTWDGCVDSFEEIYKRVIRMDRFREGIMYRRIAK